MVVLGIAAASRRLLLERLFVVDERTNPLFIYRFIGASRRHHSKVQMKLTRRSVNVQQIHYAIKACMVAVF